MRRSSLVSFGVPLGMCLLGVAEFVPLVTHAAFFGPIISTACNCDPVGGITANSVYVPSSAPAWGCILATFQNAMNFFVSFSTVIITIFIAWAGFTYMTSGGSAEKRSLANKRILNAVIGLVIVLCAWLLVDSLMKVIYNQGSAFGPWNSILAGDGAPDCIAPVANGQPLPGTTAATNPSAATAPGQQSAVPAAPPSNLSGAGGACSASSIQSAVQAEGGSISASNANVLACVAGPESSCGSNPAALVPQNNGSSALGPFQVTVQSHAPLFNNPQCEAAAGVSGPLNCQTAFRGGNPIPGTTLNECEKAADDLGCEGVVASQVYNTEGINAWGAAGSPQRSCGN
jgi:Type IV secretion system pilin